MRFRRTVGVFVALIVFSLGAPVASGAGRTISIQDPAEIVEGDAGTAPVVLTVTLSKKSTRTVSVDYETVAGTAQSGSDFIAQSGTLKFKPGRKKRTITIHVFGDGAHEGYETFSVELSNPRRATIADGDGLVAIADNDPFPIGELVISEIMAAPSSGPEFVEIYNPTASDHELSGLHFHDSSGPQCNLIGPIPAGGHVLLADEQTPGALVCTDLNLSSAGETLKITAAFDADYVVDQTTYTTSTVGFSRSLDPVFHTAVGNDSEVNWCDAAPTGGAVNQPCPP